MIYLNVDYVYICRSGENEELRYSIRSVIENLPEGRIWLIGGRPNWYTGNYIEVKNAGNKFDNITNCYKVLPTIEELSDDFVLMNDDFFILKQLAEIPYIYSGTLQDKIDNNVARNGLSQYARILLKAKKDLLKIGINDPLCYDVHVPMVFNKEKLGLIEHKNNAPRSMYGNIYNLGGIKLDDVKIYNSKKKVDINESAFISTEDNSFHLIHYKLKELFPDPSIFEC